MIRLDSIFVTVDFINRIVCLLLVSQQDKGDNSMLNQSFGDHCAGSVAI